MLPLANPFPSSETTSRIPVNAALCFWSLTLPRPLRDYISSSRITVNLRLLLGFVFIAERLVQRPRDLPQGQPVLVATVPGMFPASRWEDNLGG